MGLSSSPVAQEFLSRWCERIHWQSPPHILHPTASASPRDVSRTRGSPSFARHTWSPVRGAPQSPRKQRPPPRRQVPNSPSLPGELAKSQAQAAPQAHHARDLSCLRPATRSPRARAVRSPPAATAPPAPAPAAKRKGKADASSPSSPPRPRRALAVAMAASLLALAVALLVGAGFGGVDRGAAAPVEAEGGEVRAPDLKICRRGSAFCCCMG